jgi:hypothetical protein
MPSETGALLSYAAAHADLPSSGLSCSGRHMDDRSAFFALNVLFVRRQLWRSRYLQAQRDMDESMELGRQHAGAGPSDADFDALARLMMKSEAADADYLALLSAVADRIISAAKRGQLSDHAGMSG